ncbi:lamin tail domain-containing protein [Halomarina litorea]|uniref:lamin tail domain-containing protein n=1 Tax=Halomarina litorea TaxID=2961595 RepID=UPI0020C2C961|nr:lamin tail domain-containing protein [Halomarina sp. BCD28]
MRLVALCCCLLVVLAGCSGAFPGGVPGGTLGDGASTPGTEPGSGDEVAPDAVPLGGNGTFSVHFINVGQSSATLVVAPSGETVLVDTGDFTDRGEDVLDYLRARGIDRIDHLVTSHADADHIGGHAAVIEYFETEGEGVGAVYDPGIAASTRTYERYLDAVEQYDVPLYLTLAGDEIPVAGLNVSVLAPPEDYLAGEARNENSLVLRVDYREASVLLTGDGEDEAESYLVANHREALNVTVLAAGHHGSRSSSSAAFLEAASPQVITVSSAYDSRYGHPHEEVLRRLAALSVPVFWTATHGDTVVASDGRNVTVYTQRTAPTAPLDLRASEAIAPDATDSLQPRLTFAAGGSAGPPTGIPASDLAVDSVHADAAGDDRTNLNDEYVVFENTGEETIDLSGWTVSDESGRTYTFPDGTTLGPGEQLTLRTGSGSNTAAEHYWGAAGPVWNNDGDTVTVETANGSRVLTEAYA